MQFFWYFHFSTYASLFPLHRESPDFVLRLIGFRPGVNPLQSLSDLNSGTVDNNYLQTLCMAGCWRGRLVHRWST